MKKNIGFFFKYKDFIIGLSWWILWLLWCIIWTTISTSHDNEIKNYEYRKEAYSQFVFDYLDFFNNDTIFSWYEKEFKKAVNMEWLENAHYYDYVYHLIQKYPKIKECFYWTPLSCTENMEESQEEDIYDRNYISKFIGSSQKSAVVKTLSKNLKKFRDKTFSIRLLMDNDMYEDIMRKIAWRIYVAPSPRYWCVFPTMSWFTTERYWAECWFDFSPYMWEDKYTTVYWFSFIDEEIFEILREDLKKYQ